MLRPLSTFLQSIISPINLQLASKGSPFILQQRFFSKYLSKSAKKRLPLNTKWAGKGYVKGKRCTREGRRTSKGRFIVDPLKRLELIAPVIDETFKLKPYIAAKVSKVPPELRR